jgi:hypothetical protein
MKMVKAARALMVAAAALIPVTPGCEKPSVPAETRELRPIARIGHERIGECSGIVWLGGAFFVHNDSGDEPVLYRSTTPDFSAAEVLPLPGAVAIDWEDIAVLDGDLLIGDIGDNRRERSHLVLYRARYQPPAEGRSGSLRLVAAYPYRYPDQPHDAEALVVIGERVHIISKARGESLTHLYVFDSLRDSTSLGPGEVNIPRLAASLEIGEEEQVTAGDFHEDSQTLVLLTYTHILCYPLGSITGSPHAATLIGARQCESLCFRGDQLIFTNEQRDVFLVEDFLGERPAALLPPRASTLLPVLPGGARHAASGTPESSWQDRAADVALRNLRDEEYLRWCLSGEELCLAARISCSAEMQPTCVRRPGEDGEEQRARLGSGLVLVFGLESRHLLGEDEHVLIVGLAEDGSAGVWDVDLTGDALDLARPPTGEVVGRMEGSAFQFELCLPAAEILGAALPERFLFDAHSRRMHGEDEIHFSGVDINTIMRPYLWGDVTLEY